MKFPWLLSCWFCSIFAIHMHIPFWMSKPTTKIVFSMKCILIFTSPIIAHWSDGIGYLNARELKTNSTIMHTSIVKIEKWCEMKNKTKPNEWNALNVCVCVLAHEYWSDVIFEYHFDDIMIVLTCVHINGANWLKARANEWCTCSSISNYTFKFFFSSSFSNCIHWTCTRTGCIH